jgi:hypothetical protein
MIIRKPVMKSLRDFLKCNFDGFVKSQKVHNLA